MVSTISKADESNQPPELEITLEEFLKLPETEPESEYMNRKIYQKPMGQGKHSYLQYKISSLINQLGEPQETAYAFPELRCTFGGQSIVPDVVVFEWEHTGLDQNQQVINTYLIPPDWIIEILSPDQNVNKVISKITLSLQYGAKLGWLINPQNSSVLVFTPEEPPIYKQGIDRLPALEVIQNWELTAEELFKSPNFPVRT